MDKNIINEICNKLQLDIDGDVFIAVNQITGNSVKVYIHLLNEEIKILE